MTSQFDFTNNEWSDIASLPVLVGYAIARAEDSGRVGSYLEIRALINSVSDEAPDNEARGIIEAITTIDVKDKLDEYEPHSSALLADIAVQACSEIAMLLDEKAEPAETRSYKQWVYGIGEHVADAARENGVRRSDPEAALLARIKEAFAL